ncbi:MAG TPA: tetratricopeptide repeat protein [Phycisphaerae bacterium]|nr:tetratricopeptide repeat protein [Phycisphaerae bacterium]
MAILCFIFYWPLRHAGYIWDDYGWVLNNDFIYHWSGLWYIWFDPRASIQYYPVTFTVFLLEYKLWGLAAEPFHFANIAMQACNAIILWRLLRRLDLKCAWMAAAIFAIHPVQVETVGWVAEQKTLLSAGLGFLAAMLWLQWAGVGPSSNASIKSKRKIYVAATLFYVLALLAKTDVCTFPVVLLLILWWKHHSITKREILAAIPWLILGLVAACMTIFVEHGQAGANGENFTFSFAQRLIIAGKDIWFYPTKLFWPHPLLEVYPRWDVGNISGWDYIYPLSALGVLFTLFLLRKQIGRGSFTAAAFYVITLSPLLGFISFYTMKYTFVADHYQYIPCIGLIVLVIEPIARFLSSRASKMTLKILSPMVQQAVVYGPAMFFCAVALAVLGNITYAQSKIYSPPINVWFNVLNHEPDSWLAMEEIGACYHDAGDSAEALRYCTQAYNLTHGSEYVVDEDMGDLSFEGLHPDLAAAAFYYREALNAEPRHEPSVIIKLVHCYEELKNFQQAAVDLQKGLKEYPQSAALHFEWGYLLWIGGYYGDAAEEFKQVVEYEPDNVLGMYNLALLMERLNKTQEAQDYYQRALELSPNFGLGHYDYGRFLLAQGQASEAVEELQKAITVAQEEKVPVLEAKALVVQAQAYDALKLTAEAMQAQTMVQQLGFPVTTLPMPISPLSPEQ